MSIILPQEQNYGGRWHIIFKLLSMNQIVPFLDDMGLGFLDINIIRQYAYQYVENYEQKWVDNGLLQETFDQIAQHINDEMAYSLCDWGVNQCPLGGEEGAKEFLWGILLKRLASIGHSAPSLPLPLPEEKVKAIVEIVRNHLGVEDYQSLWKKIDKAESNYLLERDTSNFEDQMGTSPFDLIVNIIQYHKFRTMWPQITELLDESELEIVLQWGKALGQQMNMPSELLQLPSDATRAV